MSYDEKGVAPTGPPADALAIAPATPLTLKERIKARKELVKAQIISWGHDIDALLRDYFHVSGGPYYYQVAAQESQLLLPPHLNRSAHLFFHVVMLSPQSHMVNQNPS